MSEIVVFESETVSSCWVVAVESEHQFDMYVVLFRINLLNKLTHSPAIIGSMIAVMYIYILRKNNINIIF